jgi:hypothetical protein
LLRGQGACLKKDLANIRAAMHNLSARQKRDLTSYCERVGHPLN